MGPARYLCAKSLNGGIDRVYFNQAKNINQARLPTDRDRRHVLGRAVGVVGVVQVLKQVAPRRPGGRRGLKARGRRKDARAAVQRGGRGRNGHSRRPNADRRPTGAWQLVARGRGGARIVAARCLGRPQQDGGLVGFLRGAQHGCPLQVVAHGDGVTGGLRVVGGGWIVPERQENEPFPRMWVDVGGNLPGRGPVPRTLSE